MRFTQDTEGNVSFVGMQDRKIVPVNSSKDLHNSPEQNASDLDDEILALSEIALAKVSDELDSVIGHIRVGATSTSLSGRIRRSPLHRHGCALHCAVN